jgi:hypothetical protein
MKPGQYEVWVGKKTCGYASVFTKGNQKHYFEVKDDDFEKVIPIEVNLLPAPQGLTALALGPTEVKLSWNPVPGAASYTVFRTQADNGARNSFSGQTATSFVDISVKPSTTYYYAVVAFTVTGKSGKWPEQSPTVTTPGAIGNMVGVQGVSLNKQELILYLGESYKLIPIISPANATNKAIWWSSNNPKVATVDETGVVKAVGTDIGGSGNARITVRTVDGGKYANCIVTVLIRSTISNVTEPTKENEIRKGWLNDIREKFDTLEKINSFEEAANEMLGEEPSKANKAISGVSKAIKAYEILQPGLTTDERVEKAIDAGVEGVWGTYLDLGEWAGITAKDDRQSVKDSFFHVYKYYVKKDQKYIDQVKRRDEELDKRIREELDLFGKLNQLMGGN